MFATFPPLLSSPSGSGDEEIHVNSHLGQKMALVSLEVAAYQNVMPELRTSWYLAAINRDKPRAA
jgi:hypothetical protein